MNKDDIAEMYNKKPSAGRKKKYTGLACIVDKQGTPQTNMLPVGLSKNKLKKEYRGLKGYRLMYEFVWINC